MPPDRRPGAVSDAAAWDQSSCHFPAGLGVLGVVSAVESEEDSAAGLAVVVARQAVAGRRGAGDGVHEGGPRGRFRCNPRGGATNLRTNRLCSFSFGVGLCPYPDSLVE